MQTASEKRVTSSGTFVLCSGAFESAVKFFGADGRHVVLATFQDDETTPFGTREFYTGGLCEVVWKDFGKGCFANSATKVTSSYLPNWKSANVSEAVVSGYIANTFSPQTFDFSGAVGRCFFNTGVFSVNGLPPASANLALALRDTAYKSCENTEGDARYWMSSFWGVPAALGTSVNSIGTAVLVLPWVVAILGFVGGCAGICSLTSSSK